jgi:glycosyltransferase involved in cell wall biosynthesis
VSRPVALLLGPYAAPLLKSSLAAAYSLVRFDGNALQLAAAVLRHGAHIAHVQGSAAYVVAAKLCGARVVFHIPDGVRASRWVLRMADAVVVRSQEEGEAYEAMLPGQYIGVVPHGIDAAPYLRYNRRTPDAASAIKLLHFGYHGMPLEVLARLREQGVWARLTIAGSGPRHALLRTKARLLGLSAQVTFAPPAWGDYKLKLLRDADVLLIPSEAEERLEAMAAGVVPIGEGKDDADAIAAAVATLHVDRAGLARSSHACRQRIQSAFSLERLAEDFTAIYAILIPWPASRAG